MIKFGTDGWRAVLGEEYTLPNVRRVAWAVGQYFKERGFKKGILVGFDRRTLSPEASDAAAQIFAHLGIPTWKMTAPFPTPGISFGVKHLGADLGVIITSSHNPPNWNGFKIKESSGAPASTETTQAVEKWIPQAPADIAEGKFTVDPARISSVDFKALYVQMLTESVDWKVIQTARPHVIIDYMHGSGASILGEILKSKGVEYQELRGNHDTTFGGVAPEPLEKI